MEQAVAAVNEEITSLEKRERREREEATSAGLPSARALAELESRILRTKDGVRNWIFGPKGAVGVLDSTRGSFMSPQRPDDDMTG